MKHPEFAYLLRRAERSDEQPLSDTHIEKLSEYYRLVLKWNERLHLTTITEPREFISRHVLESALLVAHLEPGVTEVWDVGSGLGVPGVIISILQPDLITNLVESNFKKSVFLEEVIASLGLVNLKVVRARFQDLKFLPQHSCLVSRALEEMETSLVELFALARDCQQIILLGNETLKRRASELSSDNWTLDYLMISGSDRRLLINIARKQ